MSLEKKKGKQGPKKFFGGRKEIMGSHKIKISPIQNGSVPAGETLPKSVAFSLPKKGGNHTHGRGNSSTVIRQGKKFPSSVA